MKSIRRFFTRLGNSATRRQDDERLKEEMEEHVALLTADNLRAGLPSSEARRQAELKFGATQAISESYQAERRVLFLESLLQDSRYALRMLTNSPGFAAVALLTLALGIGANTAIFSVVSSVLLHSLPFRDSDRLMILDEKWLPRFPHFEATPRDFLSWQEQSHSFDQIGAFEGVAFNLTSGERAERISGVRVSANLPALLGVEPMLGRSFLPEEDTPGNDHEVLLGYDLWQRRFAGDRRVIGTAVKLNDINFTIVGVMPRSFRFPHDAEIWKPMGFTPEDFDGGHFLWGIGRLKPGVTRDQAQAEMDSLMPRLHHPQVWSANVFPVLDYYVGEVRTPLYVLLGAASFVLLIACVNVANLLLARGSARQREISLRAALGASRGRLLQQLLTEGLLLSLLGGILGVFLAWGGIAALKKLSPAGTPRLSEVTIDYSVLLFALLLSALTAILFGLLPSLRLSRAELTYSLKSGGRIAGLGLRAYLRNALVISEVAFALVLLTGAGLLLKSFWKLLEVQPGFSPESVLTAKIDLPSVKYKEPYQQAQFVRRLIEQLASLPNAPQAAVSAGLPFSDISDAGIRIDGRPISEADSGTTANYYRVTSLYFRAMGIPLIRGRLFTQDDNASTQPVVLINETMARRFFPEGDPIGKRLDIAGPAYLREIVGVVGDVKQASLKAPIAPQVYEPFLQKPADSFSVIVRSAGDPRPLADAVRQQVLMLDEDQPISNVRTMEEAVAATETQDRFSTFLLGLFAFLALILAAVGIYGVIAYSVAQRTHEIGIRIALGARQSGILALVLIQSLRVVLIGVGIGLAVSLGLTRLMVSLLYEVKANDPIIFVAVSITLLGVALAAVFIPARRASRVDPMVALRYE
ncbi:MAG: ABC transporter permease [Acidobacteriaceae bacterium]